MPSPPADTPARTNRRLDTPALRADLRRALWDTGVALLLTLLVFGLLWWRLDQGLSASLDVLPGIDAGENWMYWLCQAFGWTALLWAWLTVVLGLLRSSRPIRWLPVGPAAIERWHRQTSLTTIGLMFAHAFWFFLELVRQNADGHGPVARVWSAFWHTFVPGGYDSGTGVIAVLIGLLAFYLAIPLGLAYYARRWLGPRVWQALHASVVVVYGLSIWHTLLYGTNVWFDGAFRTTVWLLQLPLLGLLLLRLLAPARRPATSWPERLGRSAAQAVTAAGTVLVLLVVITGRDGGRVRGVDGADLNVTPPMVWLGLVLFGALLAVGVVRARTPREPRRRQSGSAGRRAG